jgi:hypothetical protein
MEVWAGQDLTQRVNWTIRAISKRIIDLAGMKSEGYSISNYISNVIQQRDACWRAALEYLLEHGWTKASVREVCLAIPNPPAFAAKPEGWVKEMVDTKDRLTPATARAFLIVAREYAAGNAELVRRL